MSFTANTVCHLTSVADAIVAAINTYLLATDYPNVTAERSYADFDEALEDMGTLHVDVVPVRPETDTDTRGSDEYRVRIHVGIRKRFDQADTDAQTNKLILANVDPLVLLLENIHRLLTHPDFKRLPTYDDAAWEQTIVKTCAAREHLRQKGQFTALLELIYVVNDNNT